MAATWRHGYEVGRNGIVPAKVAEGLMGLAEFGCPAIKEVVKSFEPLPSSLLIPVLALGLFFGAGCKREQEKIEPPKQTSAPTTNVVVQPAQQPLSPLEWNLKTTVAPYRTGGYAGSAWDQHATKALNAYASLRGDSTTTNARWREIIATNSQLAVDAGCHDPLIDYLHVRTIESSDLDEEALAEKLIDAAAHMQRSGYPAIHKFDATLYALKTSASAFTAEEHQQKTKALTNASSYLAEILNDPNIPTEEVYEICDRILEAYEDTHDPNHYKAIYRSMEKPLLSRWRNDYRTWLMKGEAYINLAWIYRGGGYANTVTTEGRKGFRDSLNVAVDALKQGWRLNSTNTEIPLKMMTCALGYEESGRDMIEHWFGVAMKVDSNCVAACRSKLYYLEPKWYGSDYFQLAFGRECVEATQWGGRVPLMLVEVHDGIARRQKEAEQSKYWKQPAVWLDVQDAFERYLSLNPDKTNAYSGYVLYAIRCQRWDKVKELLPKLGPETYTVFGGKTQYDAVVQRANALAPETRPVQLTLAIDGQRAMARLINRLDLWMTTQQQTDDAFKEYESVLDKYPTASDAERVAILMNEASLCSQKPLLYGRASDIYTRIKTDFPFTQAAIEANRRLTELSAKPRVPFPNQQ